MDILKVLRKEEARLTGQSKSLEHQIAALRTAINALSNGMPKRKIFSAATRAKMAAAQRKRWANSGNHTGEVRVSKLRGRKLSAAHRRAIKEGIRKAKLARAK